MFYEPYRPKKKRRRRGCLARLVKTALLFGAVWLLLVVLSSGVLADLADMVTGRSNGLPGGWTHVLLLGTDAANEGASRTDSMLIASVSGGGAIKLTSIMRDTLVEIEGHGRQKINAAYAFGGARMAMDVVNRAFGLNISRYVVIDFAGFVGIVDALGGVEVTITRDEMQVMNKKKGHKLQGYGDAVTLNGVQALRYSRIRKLDSDYMRANRQRRLLTAVMNKARTIRDPITLIALGNAVMREVKTNMNVIELSIMAAKMAANGQITQYRIPADGTYDSGVQNGVWSIRPDFEKNRALLRAFIYD